MSLQPDLEPQRARYSIAIVLAGILGLSAAHAGDCTSSGEAAEAAAIRAERQAFNRAIAGKDLARIATVLQANVILVTGTASEVYEGRDAQLALWRGDFDSANRALYARTTTCVRVSATAPVALEIGRWRGQRESAADFAAGSYAAKWRRVDRAWTLEAEIYSTETCGGDFCPATAAATQ
jgi:ketosteroid isomerase-like protein